MSTSVFHIGILLTVFQLFACFHGYILISESLSTPAEQAILCVDQLKDITTFSADDSPSLQFVYAFNSSENSGDMSILGLEMITQHLYVATFSDADFYKAKRYS